VKERDAFEKRRKEKVRKNEDLSRVGTPEGEIQKR